MQIGNFGKAAEGVSLGRKKQDSKNFFPAPPFKPRKRKAGNKYVVKKSTKV